MLCWCYVFLHPRLLCHFNHRLCIRPPITTSAFPLFIVKVGMLINPEKHCKNMRARLKIPLLVCLLLDKFPEESQNVVLLVFCELGNKQDVDFSSCRGCNKHQEMLCEWLYLHLHQPSQEWAIMNKCCEGEKKLQNKAHWRSPAADSEGQEEFIFVLKLFHWNGFK